MDETSLDNTTVMLTWQDTNFVETGYKVYRYDESGTDLSDPSVIEVVMGRDVTTFIDSDVTIGNTYYYRVASYIDANELSLYEPSIEISVIAQPIYVYASDNTNVFNITSTLDTLWEVDTAILSDITVTDEKSVQMVHNGLKTIDFFNTTTSESLTDAGRTTTVVSKGGITLVGTDTGNLYINDELKMETGDYIYSASFAHYGNYIWVLFYSYVTLYDPTTNSFIAQIPVRNNLDVVRANNRDGAWIMDGYNTIWAVNKHFHRDYRLDDNLKISLNSTTTCLETLGDGFIVGGSYGINIYNGKGELVRENSAVGSVESLTVTPLYDIFVGNSLGTVYHLNKHGDILVSKELSTSPIHHIDAYFTSLDTLVAPHEVLILPSRSSGDGSSDFISAPSINRSYRADNTYTLIDTTPLHRPNVYDLPIVLSYDSENAVYSPVINYASRTETTYVAREDIVLHRPNVASNVTVIRDIAIVPPVVNYLYNNDDTWTPK